MQESLKERCVEAMSHLCALSGVSGCVCDAQERRITDEQPDAHFCLHCGYHRCQRINTHLYGVNESYRWNGQSFYYCPLGLTFVASPVCDDRGAMAGGIVLGPVILGAKEDTLAELAEPALADAVRALPSWEPGMVTHLAAVLCGSAALAAGLPQGRMRAAVYEQEHLLDALDTHAASVGEDYPIEYEKRLQRMIVQGDRPGAQALLNDLLGYVFCANDFQLAPIRARVLELVIVLSRATIDAGADMREIFLYNAAYMREIERFDSLEDMSVWLTGVLHRFIQYSFDFPQVKHSDVVYKAIQYLRDHYDQKVSLDDVARHVYLSRAYLSSLFKDETGQSLFGYLTQIRVEKSRQMLEAGRLSLSEIALRCGFEDQSYFSKVFKRIAGMTPKKYRDSRGIKT